MRAISAILTAVFLLKTIGAGSILICPKCAEFEEKLTNQILNHTLLKRIWNGECLDDQDCLKNISHCERNLSLSSIGWCEPNLSSWLLLVLLILLLSSCLAICCCWGQFTLCSGIIDCIVRQFDF